LRPGSGHRRSGISDYIEERFGIRHGSSAIMVVNGSPVWHASHWKITETALEAALQTRKLPS
jgi:bacillithiol system protein YtxJ